MSLATDHASEGHFIEQFLSVLEIPSQYRAISSGKQLLTELDRPDVRYIHISSHGTAIDRDASFTLPDRSTFGVDEVEGLKGLLQGRIVVASGCFTGRVALAQAMIETNCSYYIAPRRLTPWTDAAIFEALFYRYHFQFGLPVPKAFEQARQHAQAQGDWQLFPQAT